MCKNCSLLTLVIAVAFIALTATAAADTYVCGDANDSGGIDIDDVVFLIAYIFSGGPAPDPGCCESDCPPVVVDHDGNTYFTVEIGGQCWMAQNLKVTHYRNGDPIPRVTDAGEWGGLSTGAYCEFNNDPAYADTYGRLYNWHVIDDGRGISPEGWHVPTDDEWKQLEMYLGMSQADADGTGWRGTDEGGKLKEAGTIHWNSPNSGATNESGFTALGSGYRNSAGDYLNIGISAVFWSSTESDSYEAWGRYVDRSYSQVSRSGYDEVDGFSIRCVKD